MNWTDLELFFTDGDGGGAPPVTAEPAEKTLAELLAAKPDEPDDAAKAAAAAAAAAAATPAKAGEPTLDEILDSMTPAQVDAWLKKNRYIAFDNADPRVKKMLEAHPEEKKDDDDEPVDLAELMDTDPAAFAARVIREARFESAEASRIATGLITDIKKHVPQIEDEDYARLVDYITDPKRTLAELKKAAAENAHLTAAKAAVYDRVTKGGPQRRANTPPAKVENQPDRKELPAEDGGRAAKMAAILQNTGFDITEETLTKGMGKK